MKKISNVIEHFSNFFPNILAFFKYYDLIHLFILIWIITRNVSFIPKPGIKQSLLCILDVTKMHVKYNQ